MNYSKYKHCLWLLMICHASVFSQGLINNAARIVFTGGAQMHIDNATGHYTSQAGGLITPSASSTITLLGNWVNNAGNTAFSTDGGGVVLAGAAQSVGGANASAFYNLSLAGSGIKTLAVNQTTVGGQATFTGVLSVGAVNMDLNSNTINITNSAAGAITRSTGFIISETNAATNPSIIRWYHRTVGGSKVYPFGVGAMYIPFTFNITTAMTNAGAYVDVSTRATASNNLPWATGVSHMYSPNVPYADGTIPVVIDRWWQIDNSHPVTANATFSYRGTENTLNALYSNGLIGAQYWGGGWLPNNANIGSAAAVSGAVVGSVTASGLSTFGPWVLTALLSPLPIELLNFEAICADKTIALNWCTASESNNDYFTIEQSMDGINFTDVSKVQGNGTSNEKHCYATAVTPLNSDVNYFRLRQTDTDGKTEHSEIVSVASCNHSNSNIIIANDGSKQVHVISNALNDQRIQLKLYNTLGQLVDTQDLELVKGYNNIAVDLGKLSNAVYYVSLYNVSEKLATKKIVIANTGE
jgi:hypothetical protein